MWELIELRKLVLQLDKLSAEFSYGRSVLWLLLWWGRYRQTWDSAPWAWLHHHCFIDRRGGVNRKVCKYLALEAGKDSAHAVPHLEEESLPDVGDVSSILSSFQKQSTSFPNFKGPLPEPNQPANTNLDISKIGLPFDPAGAISLLLCKKKISRE